MLGKTDSLNCEEASFAKLTIIFIQSIGTSRVIVGIFKTSELRQEISIHAFCADPIRRIDLLASKLCRSDAQVAVESESLATTSARLGLCCAVQSSLALPVIKSCSIAALKTLIRAGLEASISHLFALKIFHEESILACVASLWAISNAAFNSFFYAIAKNIGLIAYVTGRAGGTVLAIPAVLRAVFLS